MLHFECPKLWSNLLASTSGKRHCRPPRGVIGAWAQIFAILKRQKTDPAYQFDALKGR